MAFLLCPEALARLAYVRAIGVVVAPSPVAADATGRQEAEKAGQPHWIFLTAFASRSYAVRSVSVTSKRSSSTTGKSSMHSTAAFTSSVTSSMDACAMSCRIGSAHRVRMGESLAATDCASVKGRGGKRVAGVCFGIGIVGRMTTQYPRLCPGSFRLTSFVDRRAGQGKCPVCLSWVSASRAGMVRQHMTPAGMGKTDETPGDGHK